MNYLASPPLVVAYAIAGTIDIDLTNDPIGHDPDGKPVYLRDIWPTNKEIGDMIAATVGPELFAQRSEEHTSELQSLMRISYAVFSLKKKNQHQHRNEKA